VLDLKLIRDNPEILKDALIARGQPLDQVNALLKSIADIDAERRQKITALQDAQTKRNAVSKQVGKAKAEKREDHAQALMAEIAGLKDTISEAEAAEKQLTAQLEELTHGIPNIPLEDVPVGGEEVNKEIRRYSEVPKFDFAPKQHFELGEALGLMDFETAVKLSGSRFVVLKGALARLERALATFMLDLQTSEGGYTEVSPPLLVREQAMFGTAQLPKFAEDQFSTATVFTKLIDELQGKADSAQWFIDRNKEELDEMASAYEIDPKLRDVLNKSLNEAMKRRRGYLDEISVIQKIHPSISKQLNLIPTAEVPLTNLVREDILDEAVLPMRVTAHTPCFRAEAGAAGKDTRGMVRLHQFSKVELVSITTPEQSAEEHERMTACAEKVLRRLELPFRTIVLATGDMGFAARKTYDIEVWLPGQNAYREISSCSNCGDFQARRMAARYRPKGGKDVRFVHTLNGSGLAVGRTLIAVLENYQQADGSIRIPDVLVPYMGGLTAISAKG
jgi:seryl-tRNA synthetase